MKKTKYLELGHSKNESFQLPLHILQRHFGCFGSSGSGKTVASKVLIEELAIQGIPIIAFDPQGDIASLAMNEDLDVIKGKGLDLEKQKFFNENVEVLIWTPIIDKGLPICINPMQFNDLDNLDNQDKVRLFSVTSKNIVSLIGYDLNSDDGKTAEAILETAFSISYSSSKKIDTFSSLSGFLGDPPESLMQVIDGIASKRFVDALIKKLNLLNVGSRKLLFHNGTPADIDILLGKDDESEKTRISII